MREDLHGLAGAFALDALADDDRRRFDAHLDRCPSCREEADELRVTASLLATAVAEPPPAGLRGAVLDEVRETRQAPPKVARRRAAGDASIGRRVLAVAAALALLVGLASLAPSLGGRSGGSVSAEVAALLAAPDGRVVDLRDGDADVVLRLVWSPGEARAAAVGSDVADPGPGRAYELWAIGPQGQPTSAGVLTPDGDGRLEAVLDADLSSAVTLAVTVEPETGSPDPAGPTGPMVASGIV